MSELEQSVAEACRAFIVYEVGEDMGGPMTQQAEDMAAYIVRGDRTVRPRLPERKPLEEP